MTKHDAPNKSAGLLRLVAIQSGMAMLLIFALLMLAAALVTSGMIPLGGMMPLVLLAQGIGVCLGSRGGAKRAAGRKLLVGLCVALCLFALILMVGVLFFYPPGGHLLPSALVTLSAGILGGLLGARNPRKKR